MRINWNDFINPAQMFTSEVEFIKGSLLGTLNPSLVLNFPTFIDIFRLKNKRFRTNIEKLKFIKQCAESLKTLPANSEQLEKLVMFLKEKVKTEKIKGEINFPSNIAFANNSCQCIECLRLESLPTPKNS